MERTAPCPIRCALGSRLQPRIALLRSRPFLERDGQFSPSSTSDIRCLPEIQYDILRSAVFAGRNLIFELSREIAIHEANAP